MTTSTIADGLVGLAVPIGSLTEDPRNVRVHGKRNMEIIRSSLSRFGQRVPLVARRETGVVIAGNARLAAARELGWSEVAVLYVEDDAATATAYALVDNRSSDLSTFDQAGLAEVLVTLQGVDLSLEEIGWDDSEVEEILGGISSEESEEQVEEGGGAEGTKKRAFRFTDEEDEMVGRAISKAIAEDLGDSKHDTMTRSSALAAICSAYVE